jgi:hypothetical protein
MQKQIKCRGGHQVVTVASKTIKKTPMSAICLRSKVQALNPESPPKSKGKAGPEIECEKEDEEPRSTSDVVYHDDPLNDPIDQNLAFQFPPTIRPHIAQPISPRFTGR